MQTHWTFDLSAGRLAAAAALLVLTAVLSRRQFLRGGRRRAEALAEAVRGLAVVLVALTLLRPERVRHSPERERPPLVVLTDLTGSMATRDVLAGNRAGAMTRAEWVESFRDPADPRWDGLRARFDLRFEDFPPPPAEGEEAPDGTDLFAALDPHAREGAAPRALLVLSDGDWNLGPSPVLAAGRLRAAEVPVFGIAVGSDRYLPDLELAAVRAPAYALNEEFVSLPFTARSFMREPVEATVVLYEQGIERARRAVSLPPMAQVSSAIGFLPEREGERVFTLRLLPVPGEAREDNNEQSFRMAVRRELIRVLIVETEPRWEYRFLRNAAVRDPGVEVHTLLLHPRIRPGGGSGYLAAFPRSRDALSRYDVVFLGDVGFGPGGLTGEQAEWLRDLVESQAAGLVFLPGPSGRWVSLADSPLAPLLPVEIEPGRPRGYGLSVEGRLQLTARGRDHLLTMLSAVPERNAQIWSRLPGFYWHAAAQRAKPGAEILAVHAHARTEHGRIPLLVTQAAGSGKTLFLGMDSAWRWRRGVEDLYHYRFWGQVFRWMAHQRRMAHAEGMRFFYSPESPARGDRLLVQAMPLDASGFPLPNATVEARILAPSGAESRFVLRPVPGAWAAYQGGADLAEGGEHSLEVRCEQTGASAEARILVAAPVVEQVGRPARPEVLREIAAITGGRAGGTEEAEEILETIRRLPPPAARVTRFRLWCHPAWLAFLTAVFGLYWAGRKGLGRV